MSEQLFQLHSSFVPTGDQPAAIDELVSNLNAGIRDQVLLGVTGSGKTFTMANVIARTGRPALILAHNKTLAAQLYGEFRALSFPITTTISPKPMSLPPTPTSRRTRPSTTT